MRGCFGARGGIVGLLRRRYSATRDVLRHDPESEELRAVADDEARRVGNPIPADHRLGNEVTPIGRSESGGSLDGHVGGACEPGELQVPPGAAGREPRRAVRSQHINLPHEGRHESGIETVIRAGEWVHSVKRIPHLTAGVVHRVEVEVNMGHLTGQPA